MSGWLSLDEALENALSHVSPISSTESVSLFSASGRILANDVLAPVNVPPWDNSAMDGYAVSVSKHTRLNVIGTIAAGDAPDIEVSAGTCVRIMTGAPIPKGANAVIMQENVERNDEVITILQSPKLNENIRPKANDIAKEDVVLPAGHQLNPADLVLLSSLGIADIKVFLKPKVAVLATGSELAEPGQPCSAQQIYESHRAGLVAKLNELSCEVTDAGIVKDDPKVIKQTFAELSQNHDLVISSGGVSVGDADWVKPALSSLGTLHLWKVAIKPGKPFAFGQFGNCLFCGLPGNPVSAYVTFEQLATPIINRLRGSNTQVRLTLSATLSHDHKRRPGRLDFARGAYTTNDNGELEVSIFKNQSSGVMTSISKANCYVLLPVDVGSFSKGDKVTIQPFSLLS